MPFEPGAALEVVIRENEHDRSPAPALAEEAVLVAVRKGPADCDNGHAELIVERLGPLSIAGHTLSIGIPTGRLDSCRWPLPVGLA